MSRTKLSRLLLFLICAVGVLASSAFAQTIDKKVYFTFSGPVEIPGATLPAGKYLFHLADPDSGDDGHQQATGSTQQQPDHDFRPELLED